MCHRIARAEGMSLVIIGYLLSKQRFSLIIVPDCQDWLRLEAFQNYAELCLD
jgi:hypothetical protein